MRNGAYILLALVVLVLQGLVLNNLAITPLVAPMVYITLLLLLPIEYSQWKMLCAGASLGFLMDVTMGTAGLNMLVTMPIAILRRPLLSVLGGVSSISKEEGIPSSKRLGMRFHRYFIIMVVLHSLLFYFAEWLSFDNLSVLMVRIVCSTLCSLVLDYIILGLFTKRLSA
jgi:hypothetical protein